MAPTVAPKPKARRGRAKSKKRPAKANGRSAIPAAEARERASVAAAVAAKAKATKPPAKATKPPEEADARSTTRRRSPANGANDGQVDRAALEEILEALIAARDGDFSHRLSRRRRGIIGEIASAYN